MEIGNSRSVAEREEEGNEIEVRDVARVVEEGVTITVVGTYSATYRKAQNQNRDKFLKQRGNVDSEMIEKQSVETTARCIKAWRGFTSNGVDFPCNRENAIAMLTNAPWIREQVEEAMNDHAGFFPKSSASS